MVSPTLLISAIACALSAWLWLQSSTGHRGTSVEHLATVQESKAAGLATEEERKEVIALVQAAAALIDGPLRIQTRAAESDLERYLLQTDDAGSSEGSQSEYAKEGQQGIAVVECYRTEALLRNVCSEAASLYQDKQVTGNNQVTELTYRELLKSARQAAARISVMVARENETALGTELAEFERAVDELEAAWESRLDDGLIYADDANLIPAAFSEEEIRDFGGLLVREHKGMLRSEAKGDQR